MSEWFWGLSTTWQALLATLFTWGLTAAGAAAVFFFHSANKQLMNNMLGFSAGLMIAATFWSLLNPAVEMAGLLNMCVWLTILLGFVGGCALIFIGNRLYRRVGEPGTSIKKHSSMMMFAAITLHNIPEGMAVGVAFGSLAYQLEAAAPAAACLLALGIGVQNFPEGVAVSVPLLRDGCSKKKAFFLGQFSGMVEPVAGVIGAVLVLQARLLLPYLLSFAAGAMLYVVIEELIPESQADGSQEQTMFFTLLGFAVMMVLDIAL